MIALSCDRGLKICTKQFITPECQSTLPFVIEAYMHVSEGLSRSSLDSPQDGAPTSAGGMHESQRSFYGESPMNISHKTSLP